MHSPSNKPAFSPHAIHIVNTLVKQGYEAYIVGGAVRDYLLGHQPKDYDIATNATPEQVLKVFSKRRARIIGRRFRLCHVLEGGTIFEVSTFRREPTNQERKGNSSDSGTMIWRDNQFGTIDDDVRRRDFTVNALYCDVARSGKIIDKCGGVKDAQKRIVRVLGNPDIRFQEDPVRMLRALKLVGQHGFTMAADTKKALLRNAESITLASQARLVEEIFKILFTGKSLPILEACHKYHFLCHLLPLLDSLWDEEVGIQTRNLLAQRDAAIHEDPLYPESRSLAIATLLFPFIREQLEIEFPDLQYSEETIDFVSKLFRLFFGKYKIPNQCSTDAQRICLALPRLASARRIGSFSKNKLYPNAFELFRLLTLAEEWNVPAFLHLPFPQIDTSEVSPPVPDNIHVPRFQPI